MSSQLTLKNLNGAVASLMNADDNTEDISIEMYKLAMRNKTWLITPSSYTTVGDEGDAIMSSNADLDSVGVSEYLLLGDPTGTGLRLNVEAELLVDGYWVSEVWVFGSSGGLGTRAGYLSGGGAYASTGSQAVFYTNRGNSGHGLPTSTSASITSADVRVWVTLATGVA